jgi:adenosylhomocysteine nucleosidase
MRLMVVASDPMEFRGLLRMMDMPRKLNASVDWARSGKLNGHEMLLVSNGVGQKRAAMAVDAGSALFHPDAVASSGFCGALDPKLKVADVVVGSCIAAGNRRYSALPLRGAMAYRTGTIVSSEHIARTAEQKRQLHEQGGLAVEMEAAGVAERAESLRLPFYCVRSVTDLAGEDLANDFERSLRPDGHFDTIGIFRTALRHPATHIPELICLHRRCRRAARTLGEFFADCRF